ncbi:MAG: redoxin domain-containing protein [Pirellulales bacterium]|nr:redoxin domain-containing protein [Pirellulales bacterium]
MFRPHWIASLALFAQLCLAGACYSDEPPAPVGARVEDFSLPQPLTGETWTLSEHMRKASEEAQNASKEAQQARAVVLVFSSTSCPVCTAYVPRLTELMKKHVNDHVTWVAIASHPSDSAQDVAAYARERELPLPFLFDEGSRLAARLHIERVPTVLVLDAGRDVRYAGRIDDQYAPGVPKAQAGTAELAEALSAVLTGTEVKTPYAAPAGCKLSHQATAATKQATVETGTANGQTSAALPATNAKAASTLRASITYHRDIAPIMQSKCQECHRPGEAGPFSLLTYKQAKNWSGMMAEVVADDIMPPWHADAPLGHFKNDRRLSPEQKQLLLAWVDQGCVEGDPRDAPPPVQFVSGWRLGREPDEILKMEKEVKVPAHGQVPYEYVQVGPEFPQDRWVTGIEVRPQQRQVVHHIIAFIVPPDANILSIFGPQFGRHMLGAYVPGDQPIVAGPGQARKILKGSKIIFEVHYTPNGKAVTDCSSVGLCYTDEAPRAELFGLSVMNPTFRIPPGADNHEVKSQFTFPRESTLLSLTPHMHVRGKSFRYELVLADGKRETLLNVPRYDFNWQASYDLARPVIVPAGATLECTAHYDNSAKNPFNPDPSKTVRFGNMTTDEMMIGFAAYYENP